jgi:hypothetical protein
MRARLHPAIAATLAALFAAACASQPKMPPKFTVDGFSISMPEKDGWSLVQQSPERVVLGKPGDYSGDTLTVQMQEVKLPPGASSDDLQRYVRDGERAALDAKRFRVNRVDIRPHKAGWLDCALSQVEAEDRGGGGTTGPVMSTIFESITLTCPNPSQPGRGVAVAYIHRAYPEDRDPRLADKAAAILDTLNFSDAR